MDYIISCFTNFRTVLCCGPNIAYTKVLLQEDPHDQRKNLIAWTEQANKTIHELSQFLKKTQQVVLQSSYGPDKERLVAKCRGIEDKIRRIKGLKITAESQLKILENYFEGKACTILLGPLQWNELKIDVDDVPKDSTASAPAVQASIKDAKG
jgi:hypothetical protein